MNLPRTPRARGAAVVVSAVAIASIAGGAFAATSSSSSLPAANPTDAKLAGMTVVNKTVTPNPTTSKGYNGYQTYVVKAPKGKVVLQGFATLSGGQTGSVVIRSTQTTNAQYTVKLFFPGEQGVQGKLHVRVQLMPVNG